MIRTLPIATEDDGAGGAFPADLSGLPPIHPGEILQEDFLIPLGLCAGQLEDALHLPTNRVGEIIAGQRAITADTALRLERYFGTSAEFWLNLQKAYELRAA